MDTLESGQARTECAQNTDMGGFKKTKHEFEEWEDLHASLLIGMKRLENISLTVQDIYQHIY